MAAENAPLAAIDIGTNSIHLLVARALDGNRFEVIDREKEMVRLGSGSGDMKVLEPAAIDRGIEALQRFRQVAEISGATIHAVATSAVREAENRDVFLDRARAEAGIAVEVISGVEEARLIHLGVLQALPVFDQQILLIDIGGGSTELVLGKGGTVLDARSLKLGTIRLTERFFGSDEVRRSSVDECRQFVRAYLRPVAREFSRRGYDVAVGSSGTILNVAEMVQAQRGGEPVRVLSNFEFTAAELADVVKVLTRAGTVKELLKVDGLDPKRADIILGGVILLEQAFAELRIERMTVSDYALREGVLLDALQRTQDASLHHLRDLRDQSVRHLADICPEEREHLEHATDLALQLYDGCQALHGLDDTYREYLKAAGVLCNVGLFISHARHHLHSYYIIRNSEHLSGFTDHEIELIAQTARYHRKSAPKANHEEFARLAARDQDVVRKLAGILRVAIALDRTHAGLVRALSCRSEDGHLTLSLDTVEGADASLEVYTADARKGLLEDALGVVVDLEP
jgi:exopolyphosphatase / guanosine-5'-triphosphate,3'-diphosphate pyrophosphatase